MMSIFRRCSRDIPTQIVDLATIIEINAVNGLRTLKISANEVCSYLDHFPTPALSQTFKKYLLRQLPLARIIGWHTFEI